MIGSAIKKYARENGLTCSNGVAYGEYKGYMLTLADGSGTKTACFTFHCADETQREILSGFLSDKSFYKTYRLRQYDVTDARATLVFHDAAGTMKKLVSFLDVFAEKLSSVGVSGLNICPNCGLELSDGTSKMILMNGAVYVMHSGCVEQLSSQAEVRAETARREGSVLGGAVGALLGGIVGSIPWGIAYYFGWFVGWLGFVIGIAAKKGYELLHGKETKVKAFIIALVSAICVVLIQFLTLSIVLKVQVTSDPSLGVESFSLIDSMSLLVDIMPEEPALLGEFIKDVLLGWLFAGLGIFWTLRRVSGNIKENTSKPVVLD